MLIGFAKVRGLSGGAAVTRHAVTAASEQKVLRFMSCPRRTVRHNSYVRGTRNSRIRRPAGTGQILATNAHKGAGEIRCARSRRLVRQDACIQWTGQARPFASLDAVCEIETLEIHFHAQMHRRSRGNPGRRAEGIRLDLVGQARHDADVLTQLRVVGDVEVVKLRAVVITDQAGHLLEPVGLELHHGLGAEAVRLLAAGH